MKRQKKGFASKLMLIASIAIGISVTQSASAQNVGQPEADMTATANLRRVQELLVRNRKLAYLTELEDIRERVLHLCQANVQLYGMEPEDRDAGRAARFQTSLANNPVTPLDVRLASWKRTITDAFILDSSERLALGHRFERCVLKLESHQQARREQQRQFRHASDSAAGDRQSSLAMQINRTDAKIGELRRRIAVLKREFSFGTLRDIRGGMSNERDQYHNDWVNHAATRYSAGFLALNSANGRLEARQYLDVQLLDVQQKRKRWKIEATKLDAVLEVELPRFWQLIADRHVDRESAGMERFSCGDAGIRFADASSSPIDWVSITLAPQVRFQDVYPRFADTGRVIDGELREEDGTLKSLVVTLGDFNVQVQVQEGQVQDWNELESRLTDLIDFPGLASLDLYAEQPPNLTRE